MTSHRVTLRGPAMETPTVYNLLVIGKTSVDNMDVTSSILGTEYARPGERYPGQVLGQEVSICPAPGFMDQEKQHHSEAMMRNMRSASERGFHAVLVTICYPFRWTYEEEQTCQKIINLTQETNLKSNGILVITNSTSMKKHGRSQEQYVQEYIGREKNSSNSLGHFLNLFGDRYVMIDGIQDDDVTESQLKNLMVILQGMWPININLRGLESKEKNTLLEKLFSCTIL